MQEAGDRHSPPYAATSPWLDRSVNLAAIPARWVAWGAVAAIALTARLAGRASQPLSPGEAGIASDAYALVQGMELSTEAATHPIMVQLTGLMFFLFGDTDSVARLVPLLAGAGVLLAIIWAQRWIGTPAAIFSALIWAISPVMTMSSLRLDAGGLLVVTSVLTLFLARDQSETPTHMKPILLGLTVVVAITAHPLGWLSAPLALVIGYRPRSTSQLVDAGLLFIIGFLAGLIVISTYIFTKLDGLLSFVTESPATLWNEYLSALGGDWLLALLTLAIDGTLALFLGILAVILIAFRVGMDTIPDKETFARLTVLAGAYLLLLVALDGFGAALISLAAIPLVILGGIGLAVLFDKMLAASGEKRLVALFVVIAAGAFIAAIRLGELIARGPDGSEVGWLLSAIVLLVAIILPLIYVGIRLISRLGTSVIPMSALAVVIIFGLIGLRSSIVLTDVSADRPGELLNVGSTAQAVATVTDRVERYSLDVTAMQRSVQDPTGGHGLSIVVDEQLRAPFAWYLREFPDIRIIDGPAAAEASASPDVAIVDAGSVEEYSAALGEYDHRFYPAVIQLPESVRELTVGEVLGEFLNPLEYRNLFEFLIYRETDTNVSAAEFALMLQDEHADAFWGSLPSEGEQET